MRRLKKKKIAVILAKLSGQDPPIFHKKWPKPKKARPKKAVGSDSWDTGPYRPALPRKDNRRRHSDLRDPAHNPLRAPSLNGSMFGDHIKAVQVCVRCRTASKGLHCGECHRPRQGAGKLARAPRKNASDRVWKTFCQIFGIRYEKRRTSGP
jgi:hypothetical protein